MTYNGYFKQAAGPWVWTNSELAKRATLHGWTWFEDYQWIRSQGQFWSTLAHGSRIDTAAEQSTPKQSLSALAAAFHSPRYICNGNKNSPSNGEIKE